LTRHALALTENNELYGWGSNEGRRLGFDPEQIKIVNKPTPIEFFNDKNKFELLDVESGHSHSFVTLKEKKEDGSWINRVYQIGFDPDEPFAEHRGAQMEDIKTNNGIIAVVSLDNFEIKNFACGHRTSLF